MEKYKKNRLCCAACDNDEKEVKIIRIGNVDIEGNLILGPMAGVTDLPFRVLCKEQGASLVYTEMISAKGIYYGNKNTEVLWAIDEKERPVALQLFGSDVEIMSSMAAKIENRNFDILDVNMGCPVPKVVNNGEGSALMKNPKLAADIVRGLVRAIGKPVTVKFRKGFSKEDNTAVEFAKIMEDAGVSAMAVHGRTREQYYSGKADWEVIARVKEAVSVPVIASGDIFTPEDAGKCLRETGCDGLMLARGVRGNPWLFSQIKTYLETGKIPDKPAKDEVAAMMLRHARMMIDFKGEYIGMREMRKHVAWYTTGYPGSSSLRRAVNEVETYDQLESLLMHSFVDA